MYLSIQPNIHNIDHLKNKVLVPREHREWWLPIALDRTIARFYCKGQNQPGSKGDIQPPAGYDSVSDRPFTLPRRSSEEHLHFSKLTIYLLSPEERGPDLVNVAGFWKDLSVRYYQSLRQLRQWRGTRRSYGEEDSPGWSGEAWATQERKTAPSGKHLSASQDAHSQALLRSCRGFASQPWKFQILPVDS